MGIGVAGFEPATSSSRSQVTMRTASAPACLTCEQPSVNVRWCPSLASGAVTHFVTRPPDLGDGDPLLGTPAVDRDRPT